MGEADWLAARFEEQRARLRAVAYRMLGSHAEADDAVQNSWLRLASTDAAEIENLAGWLTTVVARECLHLLRARRGRREEPLPATLELAACTDGSGDPQAEALLADSIGPALMIVLDTLAPAERLAFVLHDIFAVPYDQIAAILERTPAATRQIASRARRRVHGTTPPETTDLARQRLVVDAFLTALRAGDFGALLSVLAPDVVLTDDSAAPAPDAAPLREGAQAVAAYAIKYSRGARFVRIADVNGTPGLAIVVVGRLIGALGFACRHDKITEIDMISEPERLRQVKLAASSAGLYD